MSTIQTAPATAPRPTDGAGRRIAEPVRILVRLTLLELRRSPMPLVLPLIAALFWFDALRTGQNLPAIWTQRASILPDHVMPDIGPITAGVAAWIAGRELRRGMGDLADSTARPRWLRQLACWGGVLGWTMLAYAACTTTIYVLAARASAWGGLPVWPIVVTGLSVATFCTVGFVAGAVFPSRFTAPLTALGSMFVSVLVYRMAVKADSGWSLISANNTLPPIGRGVFYPVPPDLAIVQTGFYAGAIVLLLGILGVVGGDLRRTARVVTGIGAAACVVGLALASTATRSDRGFTVSLLHDAASDRPIPYTPDCSQGTAVPICLHPAFAADLPRAETAFAPLIKTVSGLPGAPTRLSQVDTDDLPPTRNTGNPADPVMFAPQVGLTTASDGAQVLEFGFGDPAAFTDPGNVDILRGQAAKVVVDHIVAPNGRLGPAQQAVEMALMQEANAFQEPSAAKPDPSVSAAAQRFAALDPAQSHAWLTTQLDRLRAGTVTLQELP